MAPSPVMFKGPHLLPCETRNPGPVQFFLLLLMPDAFHALTGVDLLTHTNQHRPLNEVLGEDWQAMAKSVLTASNDAPLESRSPSEWAPGSKTVSDWAHSLEMRYVTSSMGRSLRQVERRIKQWTGQTHRQLHRLARGEETFLQARKSKQLSALVWSDVAVDSGFSDQSHFCREFRKLTGLRPEQVMQHMDTNERLWIFKTWA